MLVTSHLKSFQALDLAIRTGSLKGAADLLAITPAAVGQRIKTLEDYLGLDLVVRGRSGLRPTAGLSKALPHIARAFLELGAAAQALDFQRVNEIQMAANSDWVELWLNPRLPRFRAAYPNILFCINGDGDAPMRLGQTDVEVRFQERRQDDACSLLFRDFLIPIGSRENTKRFGKLSKRNRLEGFPLLHLDFYRDDPSAFGWPEWIGAHGYRKSALNRGIRFQRIVPGLDAVLSDAGFMICGLALLADKLDKAEVTLPFPATTGAWTDHAFQARFRKDAMGGSQVSRFRDWLVDEARITAGRLVQSAGSEPV